MGFFTPQDITNSVFKAVLHIISNSSFFFLFCIQNTVLSVSFRGALYSNVNKDNVKEWNVQMLSFERVLCFVTQLCPTLCDPTDCSPPGSSVHGILQARLLEWVAVPFSRGSSRPRDRTQVSRIAGRFFTI